MDEEMILPDDFESTPAEETEVETEEVEEVETNETKTETEAETEVEAETEAKAEDDYTKLLELVNQKAKYNHEPVQFKDLDELVLTAQKGLNHDKLQKRIAELQEDEALKYLNEKAKEAGLTRAEYIKQVQDYENQIEIKNLVDSGYLEEDAKAIIEARNIKNEQTRKEKAAKEAEEKELQAKAEKDKEYEDFLEAHPDIKVSEIPKEVLASDKPLSIAFIEYENKQLKEKLKQIEQNQKNASSSVVKTSSEVVEQESKDAFLLGLDS